MLRAIGFPKADRKVAFSAKYQTRNFGSGSAGHEVDYFSFAEKHSTYAIVHLGMLLCRPRRRLVGPAHCCTGPDRFRQEPGWWRFRGHHGLLLRQK